MNIIHQWYCRSCKRVRERAAFPKHIDANTPCLECQAKSSGRNLIEGDLSAGRDNVLARKPVRRTPRESRRRDWED